MAVHIFAEGNSTFQMSRAPTPAIGRIQGRKSYQALAEHLRERILSGSIPEGSPLPNERELGDSTGLSRGSVREALRMLEVEGLLSIKTGRNGGGTIRLPDTGGVSRALGAYVRGQQINFDAVLEAREALEPALASLAATHRTPDDIAAIAEAARELSEAGEDTARFIAANTQWHWAVAQASQNRLLISVVAALSDLLHQSNLENFVSPEVRRAVIRAHAGIENAIRAGDADAAHRRMARHVKSYRQQVAPVAPKGISIASP
jgi:GntR family transcriptional regulator, transcriptional repressor for pyruvate dehydrogenase complex